MKITYYGHACFMVEIAGKNILFDPFISQNELAKKIDIQKISCDYVFISHGHFDHVADALAIASKNKATIVSNFEITSWFEKQGHKKVHPMNHGGAWQFDFGRVKYLTAVHSSVLPDGTYGGNPGGFVVETAEGNFYYSGDTALTLDMQLIPKTCKRLDVAILPIGDNFTMGLEDAAMAAEFVQVNKVLGVHYDTFGYIKIDKEQATKIFSNRDIELILLEIGKSISVN